MAFYGIMNYNGIEESIIIYPKPQNNPPYVTDYFEQKTKSELKIISNNICEIKGKRFSYHYYKKSNELFMMGQAEISWFEKILPCMYIPSFFVASNREQV